MVRAKNKRPQPVGSIVEALLGRLGLGEQYHGWLVVNQWPEIAGDDLARRASAYKFADGTLYLAIEDDAWRHSLFMEREHLLARIRSHRYGGAVRQIRITRNRKGV